MCQERDLHLAEAVEAALARRAAEDDPLAVVPLAYCLSGWHVP